MAGVLRQLSREDIPPVECTTPLGLPVEPEVYSRNSGCSASTHSTGQCLSCFGTASWYQTSLPSVQAHLPFGTALCSYTNTFCTCKMFDRTQYSWSAPLMEMLSHAMYAQTDRFTFHSKAWEQRSPLTWRSIMRLPETHSLQQALLPCLQSASKALASSPSYPLRP